MPPPADRLEEATGQPYEPRALRYVAAFRAYFWDDGVAELARRFFAACPSARQIVLVDETRGPLPIKDYEVIGHTDDTAHLGLLKQPVATSLWYNVDYAAYILRDRLPDYDYYLTCESDLAVNLDLEPIVHDFARRKVDFVAHRVTRSTPDWVWHQNGSAVFEEPWSSLLFLMLFSPRALDALRAERRRQTIEFQEGRQNAWPVCETFVPSVLKSAGMTFGEIGDYADVSNLQFRPRIPIDDERASRPGSLVHSVSSRSAHISGTLKDYPPRQWLSLNSPMRIALRGVPLEDYAEQLVSSFKSNNDLAGLTAFFKQAALQGIVLHEYDDIAFCKPAFTSSTCRFSHFPDPQADASGANGPHYHTDYGFHTDQELNPWWMVDLTETFVIDEVAMVNRESYAHRFTSYTIESSLDGSAWITRRVKVDASDISWEPEQPHRVAFLDPFVARYLRLTSLGRSTFHLRRVQVFGRGLLPSRRLSIPL